jgi:hypothetical protein
MLASLVTVKKTNDGLCALFYELDLDPVVSGFNSRALWHLYQSSNDEDSLSAEVQHFRVGGSTRGVQSYCGTQHRGMPKHKGVGRGVFLDRFLSSADRMGWVAGFSSFAQTSLPNHCARWSIFLSGSAVPTTRRKSCGL